MKLKVLSVKPLQNKNLLLSFSNGEVRQFDVKPYIKGPWYGELAEEEYFMKVFPAGGTVAWPNGQDIAPHELYELSIPAESEKTA